MLGAVPLATPGGLCEGALAARVCGSGVCSCPGLVLLAGPSCDPLRLWAPKAEDAKSEACRPVRRLTRACCLLSGRLSPALWRAV